MALQVMGAARKEMVQIRDKISNKLTKMPIAVPLMVFLLCIFGFTIQYSASSGDLYPHVYKQLIVFTVYFPLAFLIAILDIRIIYRSAVPIYLLSILLLLVVLFAGKKAGGATRWIDLGLFRLQPSEVAKIALVLVLARFFHRSDLDQIKSLRWIMLPAFLVIVPAMLTIRQPDLGTGIIMLGVAVIMFFAAGVPTIYFIVSGVMGVLSLPVVWMLLHDYQKARVLVFLDPQRDPLGAGYNIIQSQIAIGSGGLAGKGYLNSTQSHLSFLPEYRTDFIFSFLTEELGFLGGFLLLAMYSILILCMLAIAVNVRTRFSKLMVVGLTSILFCNIFINIAMVMGVLPVVGEPLPFISSGGTMLVTILLSIGLVMNAGVNQHTHL
jgi:rod shape determining protein RodA